MNVLVTGAAGKVGRGVRRALAGKHSLRFFDLVPVDSGEGEMVVGSILDAGALAGAMREMEAVVHLAYGAWQGRPDDRDDLSFDVNAKGTYYVARAAAEAGVRRVVYASTLSLYDGLNPLGPGPYTEEDPPVPVSSYALTKYFGEEILRAYAYRGHFCAVCLRLTLPTEPEEWETIRQTNPQSAAVRTGMEDVGEAFRLALEVPLDGFTCFHIAGGGPGCPWDIRKAREVLGYQPRVALT